MGSTRIPIVFGVISFFKASASPYGATTKPLGNGPKPSLYWSSVEKLTIVIVLP